MVNNMLNEIVKTNVVKLAEFERGMLESNAFCQERVYPIEIDATCNDRGKLVLSRHVT